MEQKRSTGRLRELYFSRNTSNCCFLPGKNCIWHAKQTFSRLLVCGAASGNRGKEQLENRTTRTAVLDAHLAAMVLHDLLNDRKAQSDAFFLSITDKRLKETLANGLGDAGAVVLHTNLDAAFCSSAAHFDSARIPRNSFACIEQQIQHHPL